MSQIVYDKSNNKLWLYGGRSSDVFNDIWNYLIEKNTWTNPIYERRGETHHNYSYNARFGHTMVYYKKQIIVFGGEKKPTATRPMELTSEIKFFSIEKEDWVNISNIAAKNTEIIEPRRNHCACMVGHYMIIIGGNTGSFSSLLSDMWSVNL